eukprot:1659083-Prymnesium_polylepis.1
MRLPGIVPPPVARAVAACVLCTSLLGQPPLLALEPPAAAAPAITASGEAASTVADEVWALVDKYFLDRSFGGQDWPATREQLQKMSPLSDQAALEESERLVKKLGDRYSRVLTPTQALKLSKYDVTGVGINLVIADSGEVTIGAVPPAESDAAKLGITFGDVVLSINGRDCKGMTSFDALEAIQGDGETVTLQLAPKRGGAAREVSLRKAFTTRNPVSSRLVEADDGELIGCKRPPPRAAKTPSSCCSPPPPPPLLVPSFSSSPRPTPLLLSSSPPLLLVLSFSSPRALLLCSSP